MTGAAEDLVAAVARNAEGTPYRVVPTDDGFHLRIDVADAWWHRPLGGSRRRKVVEHHVVLDEEHRTLRVTDDHLDVSWEAGAEGWPGRVPRLVASTEVRRTLGRTVELSFNRTWAVTPDGEVGKVVDFTYSSTVGHRMIRDAARALGWRERRGTGERIGIVFAAVGLAGAVVTAGVLLTLAVTGRF